MLETKNLIIRGLPVPPSIMLARVARDPRVRECFDRVTFDTWSGSARMRADIENGRVGLAVIPTNLAAGFYNRGVPLRLLSVTLWGILALLSRRQGPAGWSDLAGCRVAIPFKGNMPDTIFRFLAGRNGVDVDGELEVVYFNTYVDAKRALLQGDVDLACLPEPVATAAEIEAADGPGAVRRLFDLQREWARATGRAARYAQAGPVVRADLLEREPRLASVLLAACDDALSWMASEPEAAAALGQPFLGGLSTAVIASSLSRLELHQSRFPAAEAELTFFLETLHRVDPDLVPGGLPSRGFAYRI
jgi:NitT/TauT family transport system substrate-binding protein